MKNATPDQLRALRLRAERVCRALPPVRRGADGLLDGESRAAFERAARRILRANRAVGATVVLAHPGGGEDLFLYGDARLHPRMPVTERTCFRVASVSKLAMTFGALSLAQDGLLTLDGDIGEALGYPARNPAYPERPVTLRMLLTHTSGIRDEGPYGTRGIGGGCALHELLADPACWLPQPPGEAFHYSNFGAGVAGALCEAAAGKPLHALMKERVFDPLGARAFFGPQYVDRPDDLACGYAVRGPLPPRLRYDAARLAAQPPESLDPERDYLCAAGRMIADARGLAALARLLASREDTPVLRADTLSQMRACQDGVGGVRAAGRGLNVAFLPGVFGGLSPVGHQGVAYGMCAELFADPESGAAMGVMTNGVRLCRAGPLVRAGFDLLALGFAALRG